MNYINYWKNNKKLIYWDKVPKKIFSKKKWFDDGRLNISFNCLDLNIKNGNGKKTALVFFDKNFKRYEYSYEELLSLTINFSRFLAKMSTSKNSRVMIHGSASIETAVSMLACSRLGFFHSVIFNELTYDSIQVRVKLFKPNLIISRADDDDIENKFNNHFHKLILFRENPSKFSMIKKTSISELGKVENLRPKKIKNFPSNTNFFCLFTSGSTGKPKGIIHSMGPYLLYAKYTCSKYFGMKNNSVSLTASDAGWINGHTYALYGPLTLGAKTIILESPLMILDQEFLKKIIYEEKISILYLPVTLIRLLRGILKDKIKSKYLKTLGSMGEPLAPSIGNWYSKIFNLDKKSIVNTYFQTETGGIITAPTFRDKTKKHPHGCVGKINKTVGMFIDKKSNELLLKNSWPGCFKSVINGKEIEKKYWNDDKFFKMFDIGRIKKSSLYINGRSDDVLNVRGHRIGSEEIESILIKITEVSEVSAVGIPDSVEGNKIIIFIKSINKIKNLKNKIDDQLIKYFGTFAIPKDIIYVKNLPKTRSGKILRRVLREIYLNPKDPKIGDLSTILDNNTIFEIKKEIIKKNNEN